MSGRGYEDLAGWFPRAVRARRAKARGARLIDFLRDLLCDRNALVETGRLQVEGEAPFERCFLADGTFLRYGYDPRPASERDLHVGGSGARGRGGARAWA